MRMVPLKDFSKVLGEYANVSLEQQKKAVIRGITRSIPDLVSASPVDTGLYASSWDFTVDEKSVLIGNYAPYADIIEHGARPFTPPLAPLLAWAKRVTQSASQPPDYDSQCWALAMHVQKKIQEHGMAPRHILENALPMIIENIRKELSNAG